MSERPDGHRSNGDSRREEGVVMRSTQAVNAVTESDIRLARALVRDAAKHGRRESRKIETIARMKTAEERRQAS